MKRQAGRVAFVRRRRPVQRAIIDMFATERRSPLAQMDADLVRAPGFQAAFHEREIAEFLDNSNVSHGTLSFFRPHHASAPAVAAVGGNERLNPPRLGLAANDGKVAARNGVPAKLPTQLALRMFCARKNDQAARVLVKPVNRKNPRPFARLSSQHLRQQIGKRGRQVPARAAAEFGGLASVTHRGQARRLVHDHDLRVHMANDRQRTLIRGFGRASFLNCCAPRP